jgi:Tol biopolymer transport system component
VRRVRIRKEGDVRVTTMTLLLGARLLCTGALHGQDRYPVRRLTTHPAQEGFPSWSPDGHLVAYALIGRNDDAALTGLWTVPVAGGTPERVLGVIAEHPDWSRDGRSIVFDADSGNSIQVVSSSGGQPSRLVPHAFPVERGGLPNWSPDGTYLAFKSADSALWVLDVRTSAPRILFRRDGTLPIPGGWSPDGSGVYFTLRVADPARSAIWRVSLAGGEPRRITPESERQYRYLDASPDGTLLVFTWCKGRNCDLWVMPSAGGVPVRLTTHPAYDDTPRWSPDGTLIAFTSTRSESFDVWVMTPDLQDLRAAVASAQRGPDRR